LENIHSVVHVKQLQYAHFLLAGLVSSPQTIWAIHDDVRRATAAACSACALAASASALAAATALVAASVTKLSFSPAASAQQDPSIEAAASLSCHNTHPPMLHDARLSAANGFLLQPVGCKQSK